MPYKPSPGATSRPGTALLISRQPRHSSRRGPQGMRLRGAIVPCGQRQSLCCISFAGFAQVAFPAEMQLAQNLQEIFPVAEGDHSQKHANAPWNTLRKYAIIMPIRSSKTKQLLCKVQIDKKTVCTTNHRQRQPLQSPPSAAK